MRHHYSAISLAESYCLQAFHVDESCCVVFESPSVMRADQRAIGKPNSLPKITGQPDYIQKALMGNRQGFRRFWEVPSTAGLKFVPQFGN